MTDVLSGLVDISNAGGWAAANTLGDGYIAMTGFSLDSPLREQDGSGGSVLLS